MCAKNIYKRGKEPWTEKDTLTTHIPQSPGAPAVWHVI